jgi:hypothetical protein
MADSPRVRLDEEDGLGDERDMCSFLLRAEPNSSPSTHKAALALSSMRS